MNWTLPLREKVDKFKIVEKTQCKIGSYLIVYHYYVEHSHNPLKFYSSEL